jgi:hypothetical protein
MAVKSMETVVEGMASMEMAPGALPHPGRVLDKDLCPPKFVGAGGGAAELFPEKHQFI